MTDITTLPAYTQGFGIGLSLAATFVAANGESIVTAIAGVGVVAIVAAYVMEKRIERKASATGDK